MDFNSIIGSLQLVMAGFQLKLDHFKAPQNRREEEALESFYQLGEAIRTLEHALGETVSFVGQANSREPNPKLASLWADASNDLRKIVDCADLTNLAFEKNLYWRNPDFYNTQGENKLYQISLDNVLNQLRRLRSIYDRLQKKIHV